MPSKQKWEGREGEREGRWFFFSSTCWSFVAFGAGNPMSRTSMWLLVSVRVGIVALTWQYWSDIHLPEPETETETNGHSQTYYVTSKWRTDLATKHRVSGTLWSNTNLQLSRAPETGSTVALLGFREGSSEVFYQITNRNCDRWTFQSFGCISERAAWKVAPERSQLRPDGFPVAILILCPLLDSWRSTHMSLTNDSAVMSLCNVKIRAGGYGEM